MSTTLEAVFDGTVFRPKGTVSLKPNTRVQITIETEAPSEQPPESFLRVARSLRLKGPKDFSERIHDCFRY